jgi:hypothetical protein
MPPAGLAQATGGRDDAVRVVREGICRVFGCDRVTRNGYDHCERCGTSYWRIADLHGVPSPFHTALGPVAGLRRLAGVFLASTIHPVAVFDIEGSSLFVEDPV